MSLSRMKRERIKMTQINYIYSYINNIFSILLYNIDDDDILMEGRWLRVRNLVQVMIHRTFRIGRDILSLGIS